ncbi:hypothetical protein CF15_07730 [Pyrodictium occultum]|uniref:SUF system FeS cluster assembly SufBD core domain-containing protein n=1 Tax=Pyrodictium occultum TaxID=2309 RepID=A0A0V8RXA8_PYROC|nr:SufD family Fe-S cluster assembly protein [Pyrodictium occultum]KSW12594.1 hypothetical protein CF15_07730 [Pyrodictium occultum]
MSRQAVAGLEEARERARSLLDKLPWQHIADSPTTKYYTDWKLFEEKLEKALSEPQAVGAGAGAGRGLEGYDAAIGCGGGAAGGIRVYRLEEAPSELARFFASMLHPDESRLTAAHYAFLREAYVLEIREPGVYKVAVCGPRGVWASSHLLVAVMPGVEAGLVLDNRPSSSGSTAVEMLVGEKAKLELFTLARAPEEAVHALMGRRLVLHGAELRSATIALGSAMHRVEEETRLANGSSYTHYGAAVGRWRQRLDMIADTIHQGAGSRSRVRVYGFALDESLVSARGLASIKESARGSSTVFEAEVLVIGEKAKGYTMPFLEIDTGDVEEASHRAAEYRISGEQLFYLESRGLSEEDALQLLLSERLRTAAGHLERLAGEAEKMIEAILVELFHPQGQCSF